MRILLARDTHLFGDEIVHGHFTAEGAGGVEGGGTRDAAFAVVGEEEDGAVGEVEGGEKSVGMRHVGESVEIFKGFG